MTLRLLAIHGSARPRGNSRRLLDEVLSSATEAARDVEVELVRAYDARVRPCTACGDCERGAVGCTQEDDGWSALESALRGADVLVLASPVYFLGLPAPVKAIVDRLQAMWWLRELGGVVATNRGPFRRAGLVLTAAGEDTVFNPSRRTALAAFNTLGFVLEGEVLAGGLEDRDDAEGRADLLEAAGDLGRRLVST